MARHASSQPTEVELQILRILWNDGPSIARHIHDSLQEFKQTTYSTTVKMLWVMMEKGLLKRDDDAKPQVYRTAALQQRTQKRMLSDLIDKVYDGSAAALMLHALSSKKATTEELREIRDMLDQLEEGA
ncbi:BlaI/MecI/CopY family transcriptional regulator [Stieleria varia]|uniref:Methicillin resistance regulatory protein MecI n=1 Tax=Stieleria varia TaxID=2528005 RepID=A0A5C6B847_9BACT|nr:BlaI/MecI/CopY family transcriptional regulator [Stieleria varia]TWU07802.1 Methicillin resistance regulatory protein MecI [Stieleria varia]